MIRVGPLPATGLIWLLLLPDSAAACEMALRHDSPAENARLARDIYERSAAILDAEVVEPNGTGPAQLRPLRVLKGPSLPVFLVATPSTCDIAFTRRGERVRVVLSGGPDLFTASFEDNGLDSADGGANRLGEALDALIGVPRPPGFDMPGGEEPPPPPRRRVTRRR